MGGHLAPCAACCGRFDEGACGTRWRVLAALLHVHIVGNSLDVSKHLREIHIRPHVVRRLLEELIQRGFPGYGNYSVESVRQRVRALYGDDNAPEFVPKEIMDQKHHSASHGGRSRGPGDQPYDKNATPAEPATSAEQAFAAVRPVEIAAERTSSVCLDPNASRGLALGGRAALHVQTGSTMLEQWKAEYLCTAAPFTMALPVGGYDLAREGRWRRPSSAPRVGLADLVVGLPRRVKGQFRRHWWFVPL